MLDDIKKAEEKALARIHEARQEAETLVTAAHQSAANAREAVKREAQKKEEARVADAKALAEKEGEKIIADANHRIQTMTSADPAVVADTLINELM
jgi:ATP synthase H subunit